MHTRSLPQIAKGESVPAANPLPSFVGDVPRVLNVGGSSKAIPIPAHYSGWGHLLLDIDPTGNPDIVWDARALDMLNPAQFDAVYCSHNLEHYYKHDGAKVLRGFLHVLKPDGFADIRVPDLRCVLRKFVADDMDLEDVLYTAPGGSITVRDVIYGWGKEIEESGHDFYAHKTGFTPLSLVRVLQQAGFGHVFIRTLEEHFEVGAFAFKNVPTPEKLKLLGLAM